MLRCGRGLNRSAPSIHLALGDEVALPIVQALTGVDAALIVAGMDKLANESAVRVAEVAYLHLHQGAVRALHVPPQNLQMPPVVVEGLVEDLTLLGLGTADFLPGYQEGRALRRGGVGEESLSTSAVGPRQVGEGRPATGHEQNESTGPQASHRNGPYVMTWQTMERRRGRVSKSISTICCHVPRAS